MNCYKEQLPEGCPPDTAKYITETQEFFRLVVTNPPTDDDFRSQRSENPSQKFNNVSECQACGLSVSAEKQYLQRLLKLSKFRESLICRVTLELGAGFIQKTGRDSHHTWWPFADFDILAHCEVESS